MPSKKAPSKKAKNKEEIKKGKEKKRKKNTEKLCKVLVVTADATVRICHQRHDEIFIIFTRTILESARVFLSVTHTFITSMYCVKRVHFQQLNAKASAVQTGFGYKCQGCMLYDSVFFFLKTTLG